MFWRQRKVTHPVLVSFAFVLLIRKLPLSHHQILATKNHPAFHPHQWARFEYQYISYLFPPQRFMKLFFTTGVLNLVKKTTTSSKVSFYCPHVSINLAMRKGVTFIVVRLEGVQDDIHNWKYQNEAVQQGQQTLKLRAPFFLLF